MHQLLKWAKKLDSIGEFHRSDKLMRIAADISRFHAREISTEIASQIRNRHSDIVKNAWATGSIAYESEKVIQNTKTKDVDIFIEIKGNWNRLQRSQRIKFLEDLAKMVQHFGSEIAFDFFMTDESGLLLNFTGIDLSWNLLRNNNIDDNYIYYSTQAESDQAADRNEFSMIGNITNDPVVLAPKKVAPIGWKMWGIHEDQDEPQSVYDKKVWKKPGMTYEDMGWPAADENMIREHFAPYKFKPAHSWWFGEDQYNTASEIAKGARKLSKIYRIPQNEIERRIRNLMKRVGAYPAYWSE